MARQQAFSSWLNAAPVMQARTGAAALSSRNKATTLARRRITAPIYADRQIPLAVQTYSPANSCSCHCSCRCSCGCCCGCSCSCLFSFSPPQQTSSRPKAAHFAAAVERSLYFVFAFAFAFAFAVAVACSFSSKGTVISTGDAHAFVSIGAEKPDSLPTPPPSQEPPLPLLLLVLRRHSERSEESPHFRGERSDPSAFLSPTQTSSFRPEQLALLRAAERR